LSWSKRYTLVLSNTRKLNRVPKYKTSTLYTNYWWSMLHFFNPTLMTMYSSWDQHVLTMLYNIIISRTFYVVSLHHVSMWLMWPPSHACVTSYFVFFTYVQIKKRKMKPKNKIKEKKNRIKPSPSFTTLTLSSTKELNRTLSTS